MTKIAYNGCFGGFSLSREAILRAREVSGQPMWGGACIRGDAYEDGSGVCDHDYGSIRDVDRSDPILIQIIEELGDAANGPFASLKIAEVQDGSKYRIDEYDGFESVKTPEDYEGQIA